MSFAPASQPGKRQGNAGSKAVTSHFLRGSPEKIFTQRQIISEACGASECSFCLLLAMQQLEDVSASGPIRLVAVCSAGGNLFESRESGTVLSGLSEFSDHRQSRWHEIA